MELIDNPKKLTNAEEVLLNNGFEMLSSWMIDNRFKKEGVIYMISHPVWVKGKVKIESI